MPQEVAGAWQDPGMILVYAGRRPGADFPQDNVDFVQEQIERVVVGLAPRVVVGSAAAGADLLVIEAATRASIDVQVLLAGDRAAFWTGSVGDKGPDWELRFDVQLGLDRVQVEEVPLSGEGDEPYREVTRRISARAEGLLRQGEELVVLGVLNERGGQAADHSLELVAHHEARGRLALRIDPTRPREHSEQAFVAMPFGDKPYLERGWKQYAADLSYTRIMTPALVDAGYRPLRADTDSLLEVIDHTMLRHLNRSKLVVADLAMLNPNVMWELGLRHAWRRSGTVLIAPRWVRSPFDVARVPLHPYDRSARKINDAAAVAAIKHLRDVLADVDQREPDSPVFLNVGVAMEEVELPALAPGVEEEAGDLLEAISLAADVRRTEDLVATARRAREAPGLAETTRAALLEQVGLALNAMGEHDQARELLQPLADADTLFERRNLQQQCANAEIRSSGSGWLPSAIGRLNRLIEVHGDDSETFGLLGAAHKRQVEDALRSAQTPGRAALDEAIKHYLDGFRTDPGDFYPGINAIALLRLRGQRFRANDADLEAARELVPVVRFAVERNGSAALEEDGWALLTLAELALHEQLLGAEPSHSAAELYARAAPLTEQQRKSAARQLVLLLDAGDPAAAIEPLLEAVR